MPDITIQNSTGEVKWCPQCKSIQQTTCSVCGCGICTTCGYRWWCIPMYDTKIQPMPEVPLPISSNDVMKVLLELKLDIAELKLSFRKGDLP